jgi:EAL domain-containing protein (putative c-di-GMP-specific phosphodiesterase class I)/DNA-binding NarL/FixJ family response regulator
MAGVPVRVLIADDQQLMAAGTTAVLESDEDFEIVGVAPSTWSAAAVAETTQPDVALVHVYLPGGGDTAVRGILAASPDTRVLAHSGTTDRESLVEMLRAGARGYLVRDAPAEKLTSAIRAAAAGDTIFNGVFDRGVLHELMGQVHEAGRLHEARAGKRARIRRVIDRNEFDIVFQPIVALANREVVGYEALSRFAAEPHRGPDEWFKEAHEVGLGPELELAAVRLACERSHALPDGMFMAVNVSPVTAERPDLLALLAGCHVDHVVLEVTEHARVDDYPRFRRSIERVRELGASLAVDDAGAGFSSMRHMLELDAELIKLDGSLTRSLEADPRRRSLASALIEFGRESGAAVLAEHVESELQLTELRRLGVEYGQGYHLGEPAPLPEPAELPRAVVARFAR